VAIAAKSQVCSSLRAPAINPHHSSNTGLLIDLTSFRQPYSLIVMPGVKGRRIPGRPGRFDPTIPLHMTTRRKAAKSTPDTDMYPDDEYDHDESRRTSFDDISVATPNSRFDSEPPAKRQRTVDPSPQRSTMSLLDQEELSMRAGKASSRLFDVGPDVANGSQTSSGGAFATQTDVDVSQDSIDPHVDNEEKHDEKHAPSPDVPATEGGSGRDETSIQPDKDQDNETRRENEVANGADVEDEGAGAATDGYAQFGSVETNRQENEAYQSVDESDWTGVVNPLPTARDFESRDTSIESSTSDVQAVRDLPLPEMSTDATPMATRQVSPATTASPAVGDLTPARTKPSNTMGLTNSEDDEDGEADDVEPATEFQDSMMENIDDDADVTRYAEYEEDDAPVQKTTKRRFAGGRRRAAHSNANVEAALRRQLEIKQFYRQVTRSMKACLGELAQITLDELEAEQQHHAQVTEYESVIAELDEQLARRKQQVLSAQRLNHEQLSQRYEAERDSRQNRCRNFLVDIKEQQLVNLEYNMLQVNRAKLRDEAKAGHETDDEDGVIPRPKRTAYRFKRSNALDLRYDSRSRFTMETERRVDDLQRRNDMWEALQAYAPEAITTFTVMDSGAREAAEEHRRNIQITSALADVANEYERMHNMPRPPKPPPQPTAAELAPLNALAELAGKPAMRSQRLQGMPMSSPSVPGFPTQSPRQGRIPLPSQSILERSAAALPNHNQGPFRRLAIEQNRGPAQGFGQFPISSLLSPSVRPSEEAPVLPTAGLPRGIESKSTLAAKPAEQTDNERIKHAPIHPTPQTLEPLLREILDSGAKLNPDRACQIVDEVSRRVGGHGLSDEEKQKLRTQVIEQTAQHISAAQNNDNGDQARRDAVSFLRASQRHIQFTDLPP
jgi:hypothetical protein